VSRPEDPHTTCRCGYDGVGVHLCHAWRAPGPVPRCTQPGVTRLTATAASLGGTQDKVGIRTDTLCEGHWREKEGGPAYEDHDAEPASPALRPVRLTRAAVEYLGSPREWGRPTGCCVGRVWHSEQRSTITCVHGETADRQRVRVQTRPLVVVASPAEEWVPVTWRRAAARYCRQWPSSAGSVAWFAALEDAERRDLICDELERWMADTAKPGWTANDLHEAHCARLAALSGGYRRTP